MFDWIRKLVRLQETNRDSYDLTSAKPSDGDFSMPEDATATEIAYVENTLAMFEELGLQKNPNCSVTSAEYANAVVAGYPNDELSIEGWSADEVLNRITAHANFPALAVLWVSENEETSATLDYFSNLYLFCDHCFDVANRRDYEDLITRILALPGDDWSPKLVDITGPELTLTLQNGAATNTITIATGKDFDLTLFDALNSLVPSSVNGRFGFLGDGGSVLVVWLSPQRFAEFKAFCAIEFHTRTG